MDVLDANSDAEIMIIPVRNIHLGFFLRQIRFMPRSLLKRGMFMLSTIVVVVYCYCLFCCLLILLFFQI